MLPGVNICIKHSECKALDENGGNCSRSFSRIPERHSGDGYILGISCKSWQIMGEFIFIVVVVLIALGLLKIIFLLSFIVGFMKALKTK